MQPDLNFPSGKADPGIYIQAGMAASEPACGKYILALTDTGSQKTKMRTILGLLHLNDAYTNSLLLSRIYFEEKIGIKNPGTGVVTTASFERSQELLARIDDFECSDGRTVAR